MERQYLNLLRETIDNGDHRITRNGATRSLFSRRLHVEDIVADFPLLTTKKMWTKGIFVELAMFLNGDTDTTAALEAHNVNIWHENTTREFLDGRGLTQYSPGDMGPMYGHNFRHFGAAYETCNVDYGGIGIDQFHECVELICTDPTSRRIMMTAWDPSTTHQCCLAPCHSICVQFYVKINESSEREISCSVYNRSSDIFLGLPFNMASSAGLLLAICEACTAWSESMQLAATQRYVPKALTINLGDVHLYEQHVDAAITQLDRPVLPAPIVSVRRPDWSSTIHNASTRWRGWSAASWQVANYKSGGPLNAKMFA